MKKIRSVTSMMLALLLLLATVLPLAACGRSDEEKDRFGVKRKKSTWLFDSIILSEEPGDFKNLFGEKGESGLLNMVVAERDGRPLKNGRGYLVCLWYGEGVSIGLVQTYLRFSLVNSDGVLYDEDCVRIVQHTGLDGENCFNGLEKEAGDRLSLPESGGSMNQGGVIIEFEVLEGLEGNVYVDCYARASASDELENVYVDRGAEAKAGRSDKEASVDLSQISVKYLTQKDYNEGDFSDDRLVDQPPFRESAVVYAVVDFSMTAANNNDGGYAMGVMLSVSDRYIVYSDIEVAPTAKITQSAVGERMQQYAEYSVPAKKGEVKPIRMIYQLVGAGNGGVSADLYFVGDSAVVLNGSTHARVLDNDQVTGRSLAYKLSSDRSFYIVAGAVSDLVTNVEIPDKMDDGTPILEIEAGAFSNVTQIQSVTIGNGVTALPAGAFSGCIALNSVRIGTGVKSIGADAFAYTTVLTINFDGTKEEWNAIQKAEGWNGNSYILSVSCSDGSVSVSGSGALDWPFS